MLINILAIAATLGIIIFVHELGHFVVAKRKGIRVENFAFGFGPELWGFTYKETRYSIRAIPFGGMVKMAGEYVDDHQGAPDEFLSRPWYVRIQVVAAGPLMNYVLAVVLFFFVIYIWGIPEASKKPVIGEIISGMPAAQAGLVAGDVFVEINGTKIDSWETAAEFIHQNPSRKIKFKINRDDKMLNYTLTPVLDKQRQIGLIGISPKLEYRHINVWESMYRSLMQVAMLTVFTVQYLAESIIKFTRPDIAGPIGIAQAVAKSTQGGWQDFIYLLGMISTGVAIVNFLPIPIADGGLIAIFLWEGITRRPFDKKKMRIANAIGLSIILLLVLLATYNDVERIRNKPKLPLATADSAGTENAGTIKPDTPQPQTQPQSQPQSQSKSKSKSLLLNLNKVKEKN